jgi:hypothetical protein
MAAAVLIVTFALLAYLVIQNRQSPIARALAVQLAGVVVVFAGDVLIVQAQNDATIQFLLRAQWLGIVSVPAGYIHLGHALLDYGGSLGPRRRWIVLAGYLLSLTFFLLALGTDLLLRSEILRAPLAQLGAGPLFGLFAGYFGIACVAALGAAVRVRRMALTPVLRRRLTYLVVAVIGPGLAVFPYLVVASSPSPTFDNLLLLISALGNASVAIMTLMAVYSIGFQGMALPDRVIRQDFVRWWLYGPVVGITIVLFVRGVPPIARTIGLPAETLLTFGVMIMTVLMPIFVTRAKPYLDALVFTQDHGEIDYLRALPRSTFTQADLRSLLENTLVVICGALRIETGFVAASEEDGRYTVKSLIGARRTVKRLVDDHPLDEIVIRLASASPAENGNNGSNGSGSEEGIGIGGFCLLPLRDPTGGLIGILGIDLAPEALTSDARRLIAAVSHQMEMALATVQMQQRLFDTLRDLGPEMQSLQQLNTKLEQATPASLENLKTDVALLPDFPQIVKDALAHYWGGPKLSDSPLLGLRSVRRLISEQGGSPTRALQAVLRQAIENLRPDQQLDPSAQEWVLYNILEMRFLQGKRIRDTAERLAMSESDLYRKQRIAVEEVARQLALMEESER